MSTPKDLNELVLHIEAAADGLHGDFPREEVKAIIRDYLSQKFQVAIFSPESTSPGAVLKALWTKLTGETL